MAKHKHIRSPKPVPHKEPTLPTKSVSSIFKQVVLTLVSVFIIFVMFNTKHYHKWLEKVKDYYTEYKIQKQVTDRETKMQVRHGYNYVYVKFIKSHLTDKDVFLLPLQAYAKKYNPAAYYWTMPNYFLYMGGKTKLVVPSDTAHVYEATHTALYNEKGEFVFATLKDRKLVDEALKIFNEKK